MKVELLSGQKLQATTDNFTIISDQSTTAGGNEEFPEPFDYFFSEYATLCCFLY